MYEVLLDDLSDDVTPHADELDLAKAAEPLDLDDDMIDDDLDIGAEVEADLTAAEDEELLGETEAARPGRTTRCACT